jgi:invasion protein IalB
MKNIFLIFFLIFGMNSSFAEEGKEKPNIEMFQDWIVSCNPNNKLCIANQTIRTDKGLPVALINITHVAGNTVLEFGLPLMMNLQKPIKVEVDENMISTYGYNTCSQSACFVIRNNDEKLLDSFKSGNKATVTAESIDRKRFDLTFSLKGFTDTINKLEGK